MLECLRTRGNVIGQITKGFDGGAVTRPGRINQAIKNAASVKLDGPTLSTERDWGDDKGYSDFTTLAFRLFGLRIEALFMCYFALMALAIAFFGVRFFGDIGALTASYLSPRPLDGG